MVGKVLLIQTVGDDLPELRDISPSPVTVMVPLRLGLVHDEPVVVTVYGKTPVWVGVPLMVKLPPL